MARQRPARCLRGKSDAILVPKVTHPGDIISVAKILTSVPALEKTRLWAMMETPMAILNARTIAATAVYAENRLCWLVMDTSDLLKESTACTTTSRTNGAEHSRTLGMDGKTLIHPNQVAPCNEIFSPTAEEVDW